MGAGLGCLLGGLGEVNLTGAGGLERGWAGVGWATGLLGWAAGVSSLLGCLPGAGAGAGVLRLEPYFAIGT